MQTRSADNPELQLKDIIPLAIHALDPQLTPMPSLRVDAIIPPSSHVLVLLIDGLGERQLHDFGADLFLNTSAMAHPMRTQFPSTTPVALGSLGTGQNPGQHGFVGASFYVPEEEVLLAPLKWGSIPHPLAMVPTTPLFEWAATHGIDVASVAREKHRNSGITRSVLRGGVYMGAATLVDMELIVRDRLANARPPALTYLYWPDLDRIGHVHGPGSAPWRAEIAAIDAFIERIVNTMMKNPNADVGVVVTSDHGMVACPPERRIHLDSHPELAADVTLVAGDPRARHIYTRPGAAADTVARWRTVLGSDFEVLSRTELIEGHLFPDLDPDFMDRLGDFMVIARTDALLASKTDTRTSSFLGQHGSITAAEMHIPFRVFHSGVNG